MAVAVALASAVVAMAVAVAVASAVVAAYQQQDCCSGSSRCAHGPPSPCVNLVLRFLWVNQVLVSCWL